MLVINITLQKELRESLKRGRERKVLVAFKKKKKRD